MNTVKFTDHSTFNNWLNEETNLAQTTIRNYTNLVRQFLKGKSGDYVPVRDDVSRYLGNQLQVCAASSCNHSLAAIMKYCEYLLDVNVDVDKTIFKLQALRAWHKIPELLSQDEVQKLLNVCNTDTVEGYRDSVLMSMLYYLGLRIGEAITIQVQEIEQETLLIRLGKGNKPRRLPLLIELKTMLLNVAKERKNKLNYAIFQNRLGKRLSYQTAYNQIISYVKECNIKKNITPHSFRHAFATHMMESGVDLRIVQEMLGHSDINTTSIYLHLNTKELRRQFKMYHPRYCDEKFSA